MTGKSVHAALAASLALLAGLVGALGAAGAAGATDQDGRVVVLVEAPGLPPAGRGGEGAERRHDLLGRTRRVIEDVAADAGLTVRRPVPEIGSFAVPGATVPEVRDALGGDGRVVAVEPDHRAAPRFAPDDPGLNFADPNAPGHDLGQWNLVRAGFPGAWGLTRGSGAMVAVIDSGADLGHPDLARADSLDRSGTYGDAQVTDTYGHGTHVAGLACGDSDNGFGVASAGFDCDLLVIKTDFFYSSIADSIVDATDRGADAINLSLGGDSPSVDLKRAINYAWEHGSIPVAAADNDTVTDQGYPANYIQNTGTAPNLSKGKGLVVTAAQHSGARADFAGFGDSISVAAYGSARGGGSGGQQGVLSTWPGNTTDIDAGVMGQFGPCGCRRSLGGSDDFAYLAGTSMATPQVAGLVALVRSARPGMGAKEVVKLIKQTASTRGRFSTQVGWGRIDAHAAVAGALGKDITPPASSVRAGRERSRKGAVVGARLTISRADVGRPGMPTSGLAAVTVYVSREGAPYTVLKRTLATSLRFRPSRRGRYRFRTVAVDRAGNAEQAPSAPDARFSF